MAGWRASCTCTICGVSACSDSDGSWRIRGRSGVHRGSGASSGGSGFDSPPCRGVLTDPGPGRKMARGRCDEAVPQDRRARQHRRASRGVARGAPVPAPHPRRQDRAAVRRGVHGDPSGFDGGSPPSRSGADTAPRLPGVPGFLGSRCVHRHSPGSDGPAVPTRADHTDHLPACGYLPPPPLPQGTSLQGLTPGPLVRQHSIETTRREPCVFGSV